MAGNPADLTIYKDSSANYQLHDGTYYGRGCKNGYSGDGSGGSISPCIDSDAGGRFIKTADNETQKNGTYYHYQAASVGTGGAIATDNIDTSDSFCPLGWQLPYSGTGGDYYDKSKSWSILFGFYSIVDGSTASATKAKSYPFSYIYPGFFYWLTGRLYEQNIGGYYWSSTVAGSTSAYHLATWSSAVKPASTFNKAISHTVRCVLIFSSLSSTAR